MGIISGGHPELVEGLFLADLADCADFLADQSHNL